MPRTVENLADGQGVRFGDVHRWLDRPNSIVPPRQVDRDLRNMWKAGHIVDPCWLCGSTDPTALHHIKSGAGIRNDYVTTFTLLCKQCHEGITRDHLPKLLYAKLIFDWEGLSWLVLTLLLGRWLPDPKPPEFIEKEEV